MMPLVTIREPPWSAFLEERDGELVATITRDRPYWISEPLPALGTGRDWLLAQLRDVRATVEAADARRAGREARRVAALAAGAQP